ncbi:hypothetical protein RCH22_002937 [Cryobacterium psychrotolerans]|nr:hypothetical protein [Cryobacterium psychrotolerans]
MRSTGFKATSVLASAGGLLTNSGVDDAVDVLLMIVAASASGSNVHPEVVNAARPPLAREDRAIEAEIGRPAHRVAAT